MKTASLQPAKDGGGSGGSGGTAATPTTLMTSSLDGGPARYTTPAGLIMPGPGVNFPVAPTGQGITRFSTAANTLPVTGNISDDTSDVIYGASNVKAISPQSNCRVVFPKVAADFSAVAVDCTNKLITFMMKFIPTSSVLTEQANVGAWKIRLYADTNPSSPSANYISAGFGSTFYGDAMTGEWQKFSIPIEAFAQGTGATVPDVAAFATAIRYAAIETQHSGSTSASFSILFGSVVAQPKTLNKGLCILAFDDCRADTFAYAAPLLARYGFPGVLYPGAFATVAGQDDSFYMNLRQLKRLQDVHGWQVAAQAYDTEAPTDTVTAFAGKMSALHNYYRQLGLCGSADGSYFSSISPGSTYQSVFEQSFRTMRAFTQHNDAESPRPETWPPQDRWRLRTYGVNTAGNSATNGTIPYLQKAATYKQVAILVYHATGAADAKLAADGGTLTQFEKTLEWLDANRATIDVATMDTCVKRSGAL